MKNDKMTTDFKMRLKAKYDQYNSLKKNIRRMLDNKQK